MNNYSIKDIFQFHVAGINHKKSTALVRGRFAINSSSYLRILELATSNGIDELFVLSTCNRTEIYGVAQNVSHLVDLLCSQTAGSKELFHEHAYVKSGAEAIEHLFQVSAGLDSQILGDYELVGQIRAALKFSKERGFIGAFMDRLVNGALQCSKAIKTNTHISGGTVSVSFTAVRYLRTHVRNITDKKILLVGTGKIGRITCKNLVDYLRVKDITLVNRTQDKAVKLAEEFGLRTASLRDLPQCVAEADIIVVTSNAIQPIILKAQLAGDKKKTIIDFSVPGNVEESVQLLPHIRLVNVDQLSKQKDETLAKRKAEIPKVLSIIESHLDEFMEWHRRRKHVPALKALKTKLKEIVSSGCVPLYPDNKDSEQKIQRAVNGFAVKMREQKQHGCIYLEAINEFLSCTG